MNRVSKFTCLLVVLSLIAVIGYGISIFSIISPLISSDAVDSQLCLKSECVKLFSEVAEGGLSIGKVTSDLLVAIATAGGILVALWNYFTTVENSALANHIAHFSTFQTYLNNEILKRNRISASSVDTFQWYNVIFPGSKSGNMTVTSRYLIFIEKLNFKIIDSNLLSSTPTGDSFRYKPHQVAIKEHLAEIGFIVSLQPRIEYYEIEDQVFSLISCINNAFCVGSNIESLCERKYA